MGKSDNRPAILGIVESALGGTGEEKKEMVGGDSGYGKKGQHVDSGSDKINTSESRTVKAPGQSPSGSRKGPRKPVVAAPPVRTPGRRP